MFSVVLTVGLGLLLGALGHGQLRRHLHEELASWGESTARSLARTSSYAVFTEDIPTLEDMATGTLQETDVLEVLITDTDGEELLRSRSNEWKADAVPGTVEGDGDFHVVKVPIEFAVEEDLEEPGPFDFGFDAGTADEKKAEPEPIGTVELMISHSRINGTLGRALRATVLTILPIVVISALIALFYMSRIVAPLQEMTRVAERMATGAYETEFDEQGASDEVAHLVGAFSTMKVGIQKRTAEAYQQQMDELRVANDTVMSTNAELLRISRRKSAFLADMSHELRTPLNAMIGFSDLMREGLTGDLNEEQQQCVGDILSSGKHLLTLINDILDIAKIESGKAELNLEPLNIHLLADEALTSVKAIAHDKGLELELDVDESAEGELMADGRRLRQVFTNLLGNGIKYTPKGKVTVRIRRSTEQPDALEATPLERLIVDVADTGVGISEADRGRVFSEFDRVDNPYSREQEGTGLGLALCKKLVELHGGEIDFTSEVDKGTTFTFTIPWQDCEAPDQENMPSLDGGVSNPLILVVEDDPASASLLGLTLRKHGYRVEIAGGGSEALIKARDMHPDAITLDIGLPDRDGWSVLSELQEDESTRHLPVIIMSGLEEQAKGLQLGARAYLVKPVDRQQLFTSLQSVVSLGEPGTVLAIDDDETILRWYERVLGAAGWMVKTAPGGREGLEMLKDVTPDVMLLDLMMPGFSGFDVLEELEAAGTMRDLPVLLVTAKDLSREELERLEGSVGRVLQKGGFSGGDLVRTLLGLGHQEAKEVQA